MWMSSNTTSGVLWNYGKNSYYNWHFYPFFHAFILFCWSSKIIWSIRCVARGGGGRLCPSHYCQPHPRLKKQSPTLSIVLIKDLIETTPKLVLSWNLPTYIQAQPFLCHKTNFTSTTFQLGILQNEKGNIIKFFNEKSAKFGSRIMWQEKEYRP